MRALVGLHIEFVCYLTHDNFESFFYLLSANWIVKVAQPVEWQCFNRVIGF